MPGDSVVIFAIIYHKHLELMLTLHKNVMTLFYNVMKEIIIEGVLRNITTLYIKLGRVIIGSYSAKQW